MEYRPGLPIDDCSIARKPPARPARHHGPKVLAKAPVAAVRRTASGSSLLGDHHSFRCTPNAGEARPRLLLRRPRCWRWPEVSATAPASSARDHSRPRRGKPRSWPSPRGGRPGGACRSTGVFPHRSPAGAPPHAGAPPQACVAVSPPPAALDAERRRHQPVRRTRRAPSRVTRVSGTPCGQVYTELVAGSGRAERNCGKPHGEP